jgi:hypothetical protein
VVVQAAVAVEIVDPEIVAENKDDVGRGRSGGGRRGGAEGGGVKKEGEEEGKGKECDQSQGGTRRGHRRKIRAATQHRPTEKGCGRAKARPP